MEGAAVGWTCGEVGVVGLVTTDGGAVTGEDGAGAPGAGTEPRNGGSLPVPAEEGGGVASEIVAGDIVAFVFSFNDELDSLPFFWPTRTTIKTTAKITTKSTSAAMTRLVLLENTLLVWPATRFAP